MTQVSLQSQAPANLFVIEDEKTIPVNCTDSQRQSDYPNQIRSTTYLVDQTSDNEDNHSYEPIGSLYEDRPKTARSSYIPNEGKRNVGPETTRKRTLSEKYDKKYNPKPNRCISSSSKRNVKGYRNSPLPYLTEMNIAMLKKAKLLNSPYLQGIKELESNIGDGIRPSKTADPYTKSTFLENTGYNLDRKISRTRSAGALDKCMNLVTEKWGRVLSAISGSVNTRENGYNGSRICNGMASENPFTLSEVDRVKAQYKNFLCQTNITEPKAPSSARQQMPRPIEVENRSKASEKKQAGVIKERNSCNNNVKPNISLETSKKPNCPGGTTQTEPNNKNIKNTSFHKKQSKAQQKMQRKVRDLCYNCDRSKYWSNEIRNYYEWNAFCLLRKYRKNTQKIKEEMKLLAQDGNYETDELWKRAEAFHDFIQVERDASAKSMESPGIPKKIDAKKFRYNPYLATARVVSNKERANVTKAGSRSPKNVIPETATYLVPPPRAPELSFLLPKIHRDIVCRKSVPKIPSKPANRSVFLSQPSYPKKTSLQGPQQLPVSTVDKLKSKILMELVQYSHDKCPLPVVRRPKSARENFSTPRWEPVDTLELVTSYIPESKSTCYISKRNKRR
ncbi:hypothetical protein Ocin01_05562 [Orchesella cincta]|uniref:Uncharacterized protein n=1 Tax=Orchesella cincta TaxID=48709 RepID=A0A1D2N772_ORCCI|nr:hypothetical protein Ocin01_05562 [Orchesella cincta]